MKKAIGIDIGGTITSVAIVDENFEISSNIDFPTPRNPEEAAGKIIESVNRIDPEKSYPCGIAVCGLISQDGRILYSAPNLKWKNIELEKLFSGLDRQFAAVNDGSSAAWGCYIAEGNSETENLLSITMGTGVGGGIVLNGNLIFGAAEIGHIKMDPDGPVCGCGKKGCLETYIGGIHIPARAREWEGLEVDTTQQLFELAEAGNRKAVKCWERIGFIAGYILAGVVNLNGSHKILLGGTVASYAGVFFIDTLRKTLIENLLAPEYQHCEIEISKWKNDISLLGAAALLLKRPLNMDANRIIDSR